MRRRGQSIPDWLHTLIPSTLSIVVLSVVIVLASTNPVLAQNSTENTVNVEGDNSGQVAAGDINNTTVNHTTPDPPSKDSVQNSANTAGENGTVLTWLSNNTAWLGSVGAIAAVIALFLPILSRKINTGLNVTTTGGEASFSGDVKDSQIAIGASNNHVADKSSLAKDTLLNSIRIRVLLVFANPIGTNPLRTQEENRAVLESIQLSEHRSCIHVETLPAATIDDLRRALLKDRYEIVHFSGHGTEAGLFFEDQRGQQMMPSSKALAELLIRHQVGTAIFNACHSLSVGNFSSMGLDYTISSTDEILDPAAIEFSRGFYDAIGAGKSILNAYQEGMSNAELKGYSPKVILLRRGEKYSQVVD